MKSTISISDDKSYINLKITGDVTRQASMQKNKEAHALGQSLGIRRYLVDMTEARNVDSVIDQYEFAYHDMVQQEGIDRAARVAVVVAEDDHSHDFIEVVAQNTGLNTRLFRDMSAAKAFLQEDDGA